MQWDGTVTNAGHEMFAKLMTGDISGVTFGDIRLLDSSDNTIIKKTPDYTPEQYSDDTYEGWRVKAEIAFYSSEVTAEVHKVQLLDSEDNVISEKSLDTPWAEGESVIIQRHDYFVTDTTA